MTFTPKSYTAATGKVYALDLNQMDANDDHIREEANYYPVVTVSGNPQEGVSSGSGANFVIHVDGSAVAGQSSVSSESTGGVECNIDISGLSDGIHEIKLVENYDILSSPQEYDVWGPFWFYKSPDMNYLSHKVVLISGSPDFVAWTVIGHRETKTWT